MHIWVSVILPVYTGMFINNIDTDIPVSISFDFSTEALNTCEHKTSFCTSSTGYIKPAQLRPWYI
jgi:hypothetical protein